MTIRLRPASALTAALTMILLGCGESPDAWPARVDWEAPPPRPPSSANVEIAEDACLMAVRDGTPTAADVGQASRMVSPARTFEGSDQPWFGPVNRGGQWTIDADGRYAVFPGAEVRQGLGVEAVHEQTRDRTVAVADGLLWILDAGASAFRPLTYVEEPRAYVRLLRVERLDLTLLLTSDRVLQLRGDRVVPWPEGPRILGPRRGAPQAFDLPGMKAVLFVAEDGGLHIRQDDGRWSALHRQGDDPAFERIEQVVTSPSGRTALLRLRSERAPAARYLALMRPDDSAVFRTVAAGVADDATGRVIYVEATDEILRFQQAGPSHPPLWSRLTPEGYQTVAELSPERNGDTLFFTPTMIARRDAMVFPTASGLAIYKDGRMKHVVAAGEGLGRLPKVIDLPSVERTVIQSIHGLFELTDDDRIVRIEAPFTTGGLPAPIAYDDATDHRAVFFAAEGQFVLGRDGGFRRVVNGRPGAPAFANDHVLELPVSGDDLILHQNALWLLVSPRSNRWARCLAG